MGVERGGDGGRDDGPGRDHTHRVGDQHRRVQYEGRAGEDREMPHLDTGEWVPPGEIVAEQRYIDHAGQPTVILEHDSGRVDEYVGVDQLERHAERPWAETRGDVVEVYPDVASWQEAGWEPVDTARAASTDLPAADETLDAEH